ncbi:MAG: hypothetical protein GYA60_03195 [Candidatus Methanofastidiosa archaeon]|nr:hypothetical protein [Candidatus Methanofastidiosa archaeon]
MSNRLAVVPSPNERLTAEKYDSMRHRRPYPYFSFHTPWPIFFTSRTDLARRGEPKERVEAFFLNYIMEIAFSSRW